MKTAPFRKNVAKTVDTRAVRLGLRTIAKNGQRAATLAAVIDLRLNAGSLLNTLTPYILGMQFKPELPVVRETFGDVAADLAILSRNLKVKLPTSTKKARLVGTRTAALLQFDHLTNDLLGLARNGALVGPQMKTVTKVVTIPNKGKEEREVQVVDGDAVQTAETDRASQMATVLELAIGLFWQLTFDIFGEPPAAILQEKFARLQVQYPSITFDESVDSTEEAAEPEAVTA